MAVRFSELDKVLAAAVVKGDVEAARRAIVDGADVTATNDSGHTLLILSMYHKHLDMSRFLLEQGVSIRARDNTGWDALMHAVTLNDTNHVRLLAENKAPLNEKYPDGLTILMRAAMINPEITEILLKAGAEKDTRDGNRLSALDYALLSHMHDCADVLLRYKAYESDLDKDLEIRDKIEDIFRKDD